MFSRIELTGFRGFESYRLGDLRRVNLLVGKNDSGKTSVLEAVHLLSANGNPQTLDEIIENRSRLRTWTPGRGYAVVEIASLFFGYCVSSNSTLMINTDNGKLSIKSVPLTEREQDMYSDISLDSLEDRKFEVSEFGINISNDGTSDDLPPYPVSESGLLAYSVSSTRRRRATPRFLSKFLTSNSLGARDMRPMWENMLRSSREEHVVQALRTLQPNISALHFLSGYRPEVLASIDEDYRIPFHSFGEGSRRFLVLSLLLADLENGLLLIDEIDTGLHWTVMEDLWRLVIGAARNGNVQVFATTHSYDCIKGLASLLEREPELAEDVSLQKLERRLDKAVAFRGEQIPRAVSHHIELR